MSHDNTEIGLDELHTIMTTLLAGLGAYGEVERIRDDVDRLHYFGPNATALKEQMKERNLIPIHPTGAHSIDDFHAAMCYVHRGLERITEKMEARLNELERPSREGR